MKPKAKLFIAIFLLLIINTTGFSQKSYHADSINVLHYNIHLDITDITNKFITGYTELKIVPKIDNLHNIQLDLLSFFIDSVIINGNKQLTWDYDDTLLSLPLSQVAHLNDTLNVSVHYYGYPQEDPGASHWGGFKFTSHSAYNLGVGFEAIPHNFGRCWFPCNDNFTDRATYDFRILVQATSGHVAVCNGTLLGKDTNCMCTGKSEFHWAIANEIPTYLASVAVDDYVLVPDTFAGLQGIIPIQLWVRQQDSLRAVLSFVNLKNILTLFESKFGPYRWERVGYVGVDFDSGAMEHATSVAYPNFCINGNTSYEGLYTHELAHSWFGNLITCSTAQDMWINEGWATFSEMVYEEAFFGKNTFLTNKRVKLNKVLRYNQIEEGDYVTLNQVPDSITYGSSSYDKGSLVVQTLRSHIGDSLFYACVKDMLETFKFKDISSAQMRDYLSTRSGMDLSGFFDNWVFTSGFPHFAVDSFNFVPNASNFDVTVYVREKLRGRSSYSNGNRLEITFIDSLWNKTSRIIDISGGLGSATYTIPFMPVCTFMDLYEKTDDATSDTYKTIKTIGTYSFDQTYFTGVVSNVTDSAFVRAEHNWVAPDDFKTPIPGVIISHERYWKIDGLFPGNFVMKGKFYFSKLSSINNGYLDQQLLTNVADSIVLLYRQGTSSDWNIVPSTRTGTNSLGYIISDSIKTGEYAFGIRNWQLYHSTGSNYIDSNNEIRIIPNPASQTCTIKYDFKSGDELKVVDIQGKIIHSVNSISTENQIKLAISEYTPGLYFIQINRKKGKSITGRMIVE
jgi:aminopeptidase N